MLYSCVNLDFGSSGIRLNVDGKIAVDEPSLVAAECCSGDIKAVGSQAAELIGKSVPNFEASSPISAGRVHDFARAEALLRFFLRKVSVLRRVKVRQSLPVSASSVDIICWKQILSAAGAAESEFVSAPLAAALGAGVDMKLPGGIMVIDIGAGKTDAAVLSMGEVIVSGTTPAAGDYFDREISRVLRGSYNMSVPKGVVEQIKKEAVSACPLSVSKDLKVSGFDLTTGLPCERLISSELLSPAIADPLNEIAAAVIGVLRRTPCELSADLVDNGVVLVGGGALMSGMGQFFTERLGLPVKIAAEPRYCAAYGCADVSPAQFLKSPGA